jgi:hypothetical protein
MKRKSLPKSPQREQGKDARRLFDHMAAQRQFGASALWLRRLPYLEREQAAVEYWQVKRGCGLRAIVEIVAEKP